MEFLDFLQPLFFQVVLPIAGTAISALATVGAKKVLNYVKAKTDNEAVEAGMARICHTVETTVADLNQRLVPEMIARSADGKLRADDAAELKEMAVATVYRRIRPEARNAVATAVNSVDELIRSKVEQAVGKQKADAAR